MKTITLAIAVLAIMFMGYAETADAQCRGRNCVRARSVSYATPSYTSYAAVSYGTPAVSYATPTTSTQYTTSYVTEMVRVKVCNNGVCSYQMRPVRRLVRRPVPVTVTQTTTVTKPAPVPKVTVQSAPPPAPVSSTPSLDALVNL